MTLESSSTTTSTQSTSTGGSDDNDEEDDGGPNTGIIVGAVIGSVGAAALIAIAFWLGVRHARGQASKLAAKTGTVENMAGDGDMMSTVPQSSLPVSWVHSMPLNSEQQQQQQLYNPATPPASAVQGRYEMSGATRPSELWAAPPVAEQTVHGNFATPRP